MSKRNAMRIGPDPHSAESVAFTVKRYGVIKQKTLYELLEYLNRPEVKEERVYELFYETISDIDVEDTEFGAVTEHGMIRFPVIKTRLKKSAIEKYIDNEHDAQNTLANIRNLGFPKNKQGQ